MSQLRATLSVCNGFIANAFLKMLAYRLRYYMGIVTYLLFVSVHYFIWQAVYANREPGAVINGYNLAQMITYIAVGWMARSSYFSNIDDEMDDLVRSGQISIFLIRPVNFYLMMISQAVGESLFRVLFFSAPIAVTLIFIFPISGPASVLHFVLFSVATIFGFFILANINFLIGLLAFELKSIDGVMRAKYYLTQLLSGLLIPFTFFPPWLERFCDFLPFKSVAYTPLQFYLGKISVNECGAVFFNQIIWLFILSTLCLLFWQRAFNKLTLQGG